MIGVLGRRRARAAIHCFYICLALFAPSLVLAGHIPQGWESYLSRPDILEVRPQEMPPNQGWSALKEAHFSFVAEILALYPPDVHIYFLARDSEHLYDVARLVTEGTETQKRIHLLNVSRANMGAPNLREYLEENGISEGALKSGRKVLFVDTGFAGTIPRVIGEAFSENARAHLKTHLVVSSNPQHPSSRVFLSHLNPSINDTLPSTMHGSIVNYEHMPRYTDRSSHYVEENGRLHPISPLGAGHDGSVSKDRSLRFMQDLRAEWEKPETRARFNARLEEFKNAVQLLGKSSKAAKTSLGTKLKKLAGIEHRLLEAFVRDAVGSQNNLESTFGVTLGDLNLKEPVAALQPPSKEMLIKQYPEWAPILENPETEIPKLFEQKNWQMIGNLIDAPVDIEIRGLLANSLYDAPAQGLKWELQVLMIEKADFETLDWLASHIFSKDTARHMEALIRLVLEKADQELLEKLAEDTFCTDHGLRMKRLIKIAIEKADNDALVHLARLMRASVSKDFQATREMTLMILERGGPEVVSALIKSAQNNPVFFSMSDVMKILVERASRDELYTWRTSFRVPPEKSADHILRQAMEIPDPAERRHFLHFKFLNLNALDAAYPSPPEPVSRRLQPGQSVDVEGRTMKVLDIVGQGRRGIVFKVQAENGAVYALKVAKDGDPETLESFAKESEKAKQWQEMGLPHAKVLLQESNFVLKAWIEGISGNEVVERYAAGDVSYKPAADAIMKLVAKIRAQGAYIGDFRPANLIWNGKAWVIVDSGSIDQGLSFEKAQAKWAQTDESGPKFERRWGLSLPPAETGGAVRCENVFH